MDALASQPQRQTLHAIVYPVCVCGYSFPAHIADETPIQHEYQPVRPVEDLGCISDKVVTA